MSIMVSAASSRSTDAIAAAARRCLAAGEQLTPIRKRVLELLVAQHGPVKAYDLLESLKRDHAAAKPPTVYRALEFLVRLGLAHRVESQNAFIACDGGHDHAPAIVLLCDRCGAAQETSGEAAREIAKAAADAVGFKLERVVMEATGTCAACRAE